MLATSVSAAAALAVGLALVASGLGKAADLRAFERALRSTYRIPTSLVTPLAIGTPVVEVAAGVLALLPSTRFPGLIVSAFLVTGVGAAAAAAWVTGSAGDCGCWGALRKENLGPGTIVRALAIVLIAVVGAGAVASGS